MKSIRLSFLLASLCAAAFLTACDDPTNVGADLVGAQGGQPETGVFPVTGLQPAALERADNVSPRVLAGGVDDPALGRYEVHGYFDITPVTSEDFRAGTVQSAELRLTPTYVYGDTTGEVTLAVRDVAEAWEPDGLQSDTSLSVGPVIREFTFLPTDTLVVVSLPAVWVAEHDEILRSSDFGDRFHGFRLDPVAGNAVIGFGPSESGLIAETEDETSSSPFGISFPRVERTTPVELPPDRFLMQAGTGPALSFTMSIEDVVPSSAVNKATVTLRADTLTLNQNLPPHFVRPTLQTLDLFGITSDDRSVVLSRATLNDEGQFVFDTPTLALAVQNELLGSEAYNRFELRIPDPSTLTASQGDVRHYYNSLNPVIFYDAGATEEAPTVALTTTPLD